MIQLTIKGHNFKGSQPVNLSDLVVSESSSSHLVGQHSMADIEANVLGDSQSDTAVWGPGSKGAWAPIHRGDRIGQRLGVVPQVV